MEEESKRWTAKRKAQLVLDILQGRATVAVASRAYDLPPSDIEEWVEDGRKGMDNALRTKRFDIKEHYEKQIRKPQEAYGETVL
jgi:transposase-like protein